MNATAVRIWNDMGGEVKWQALDVLVEFHGITEVDQLIRSLLQIQDYQRQTAGA